MWAIDAQEGALAVTRGREFAFDSKTDFPRNPPLDTDLEGLSRAPAEGHGAFMSIPAIRGCYERVAADLDEIVAETGIDGCLFSFPNYAEGIRDFGERILPRLSSRKSLARVEAI
jgi:alkanesulfonate monooxygenase SsuD/methylene tetrahydromethanopterin reductase-like flavin-dependent oxidoreductase (luciferase family)